MPAPIRIESRKVFFDTWFLAFMGVSCSESCEVEQGFQRVDRYGSTDDEKSYAEWNRIEFGAEMVQSSTALSDDFGAECPTLPRQKSFIVRQRRELISDEAMDELDDIKYIKSVALISHNNMKATMKNFVRKHKDILVHFTLTGTANTLKMVTEEMKEYHQSGELKLGVSCSSGPYGGDAQLAALIASGYIGCVLFFVDPLSAHPHQADVESLLRLARVHEILLATNVMTAYCVVEALRAAVQDGRVLPDSMKSSKMSESVAAYKRRNSVLRGVQLAETALSIESKQLF